MDEAQEAARRRYLKSDHRAGFHEGEAREDCPSCGLLTRKEQETLRDIVSRYIAGTATAATAAAWIYGLVSNSKLNDGSFDQ
jgi:hypothetical protein